MNTTADHAPSSNSPAMVLIVDDDTFSQKLLCAVAKKLGITDIHIAIDGRAGLRTLADLPRPPDVLICDVFMPDMDGIEFMAELARRDYKGGIILVSGQDIAVMAIAQQVAVADGLKVLGAYAKPVPVAILADALARSGLPLAEA